MIRFKYNDKVYETPNLIKKLRRMKITENDIEILYTPDETIITDDKEIHYCIKSSDDNINFYISHFSNKEDYLNYLKNPKYKVVKTYTKYY